MNLLKEKEKIMRVANIMIMVFIPLITLPGGCKLVEEPIAIQLPAQPISVVPGNASIEHRFTDAESETGNVVESALMWSQKYEELSVKTEKLREEKNILLVEKTDIEHKLSELKAELDGTKTELAEANSFLQEMQAELTRWKADVLGFRDEIRSAQAAQLQALEKILRILGAEPVDSTEPEPQPDQNDEQS